MKLSGDAEGEFGEVLLIGQRRMNELILEELRKYPCVEVRFGHKCVGIEDNPEDDHINVTAHKGLDFNRLEPHDGDLLYRAK